MSKRPADASPEMRVPPKRSAGFSGPIQTDQNNNVAEDCDDYVLVDKRRRQRRKPQPQMPINSDHASRALRPRPPHRRAHHRPDAIIIKADDPSTYANILKKLKGDPALQQTVGSSVNNIRRSAAGALVLQLKKGVDNASDLGEELGKVLGTTATASALQHTSMIEIKDLDESVTKEEITMALDALLGVPVSRRATPVPTARSSATDAARRATKQRTAKANHRAFSAENEELTTIVTRPQADKNPPAQPQSLRGCPGPALRDTISKLRIDVAILCEQYKNLAPPNTWLADADGQAAIWVHGGISGAGAPSASTSLLRVGPNRRNFLFQRLRSTKTL
ncbi:unnamed protein product [Trichogramma brassicae]|uniref:Uncharacterized protein n=1 Tax=Trichogramma brassicae TaxID=86971 RepID=A0A6H5HWU4_9HYME|nr:unnamed protein product [Trichogramma brassicae]